MAELKLTKPGDEGEALKKTCVEKMLFFSPAFWYQKTGVHCLSQMLKDLQGH